MYAHNYACKKYTKCLHFQYWFPVLSIALREELYVHPNRNITTIHNRFHIPSDVQFECLLHFQHAAAIDIQNGIVIWQMRFIADTMQCHTLDIYQNMASDIGSSFNLFIFSIKHLPIRERDKLHSSRYFIMANLFNKIVLLHIIGKGVHLFSHYSPAHG